MTKITFYRQNQNLKGFEIEGHAGELKAGENPLCAAISVASQMTVLGIKDELKLNPFVKVGDGYLKLLVNESDVQKSEVQLLLQTCLATLKQIQKNNKKYVRLEVKEHV